MLVSIRCHPFMPSIIPTIAGIGGFRMANFRERSTGGRVVNRIREYRKILIRSARFAHVDSAGLNWLVADHNEARRF